MDAFYASVEQRDDPSLRGRPIVVGGDPDGRGVVATASYEARKFGLHSAMPASQARRLCPECIFVRPNMAKYRAVSKQIRAVFHEATDLVEPLSLDEAYLDVTVNKLGFEFARDVAKHIRQRIWDETQLTASAGVAPNKLVAKVASDLRKPGGMVIVPPERVQEFIDNLVVEKIWGVGPATAKRLHALGIRTGYDMRQKEPAALEQALGKHGRFLAKLARGEDPRAVTPNRVAKSRGAEITLSEDVVNLTVLEGLIDDHAERLAISLQRLERPGKTVTLKVRYNDFETITRSRTLPNATSNADLIAKVARELLHSSTEAGERPIRLVGVSVSALAGGEEGPEQLWLDLTLPLP
jgi:DNA polymerase-4